MADLIVAYLAGVATPFALILAAAFVGCLERLLDREP